MNGPEPNFLLAASLAGVLVGNPVRVGTENAAKLAAVRMALVAHSAKPESLLVIPTAVASGVPDQPVGWEQITAGARNRARTALAVGDCTLAVGIEDGLVRLSDQSTGSPEQSGDSGPESSESLDDWFNIGCAWITDGEREGHGYSSAFAYPPDVLGPALSDQAPIGDLFDDHWSRHKSTRPNAQEAAKDVPSGRGGGNIGRLTGGQLERAAYGSHAVACALIRFLHSDLYD